MAYFHAGGIDRPLVITKNGESIVPHQNWRGQFARGTYADGAKVGQRSDCTSYPPSGCTPIQWPGERTTARHELEPDGRIQNWFGGLVDDMRDASGQMYRRNRYYDPQTGQFTQPDPIGLAGGLNAYGFAEGDPVTYGDPYGVCPYGHGKRDTNTADCPDDRMGDAMRMLDARGRHIGDEVIATIAREGLDPRLVDEETIRRQCGSNAIACTAGTAIYMNEDWSVGALAVGLAHEVFHVELGDTRDGRWYRFHEHSAWDRSMGSMSGCRQK